MMYEIRNGKPSEADFTFYGGAREFATYHGSEALLHGPAETGKTISALNKLHICACKYPGASIVIARKTLSSTYATVLQTFQNKILDNNSPCAAFGGSKPEWFDYTNGSRIWIAGLDKSSKILSAEHDIIYINQVEECELDDWETATTRATGRAGNMPYAQTLGDANPSYPGHWMYSRESIRIFYSKHSENPALYDQQTGQITEQGKRTIAILEALTGTRRKRLYEGKPAQAEGVIYEDWDEAIHLIYQDKVPPGIVRYIAGQDWGYTHAGSLGVAGIDNDGRIYLVAQIHHTKKTIDWWTERAKELHKEFKLEAIACGPDQPAYIDLYKKAGLPAVSADNSVLPGINAIQQRLKPAEPRLFVVRDGLRYPDQELIDGRRPHKVEDEFPSYVWSDKSTKEIPVKEEDDGLDMLRYLTMQVDGGKRKMKFISL